MYRRAKLDRKRKVSPRDDDLGCVWRNIAAMAKPTETPRLFIKAWRKHRGMTQEQLAEVIETTKGNISLIERGVRPWNQRTLEAIAEALGCSTVDLLTRDPSEPMPIWEVWDKIDERDRPTARIVLEGLAEKSTRPYQTQPPPAPAKPKRGRR